MTPRHDGRDSRARPPAPLVVEVFRYLRHRKRWWLTPVLLVLVLLAAFAVLLGGSPILPFIYTIF